MKLSHMYFRATIFAVALAGCSVIEAGTAKQIEGVEGKKMSDGTWYLYDTPSHWAEFQRIMDMHIDKEKSGDMPYRGHKTSWNEFWGSIIRVFTPQRQENAPKYIAYIIESRRKAGLPELEGYR